MTQATIAFTTTPDESTAKSLAKLLLESRLAACVSIIDSVQSHYWWDGKIETSAEKLLLIKTQTEHTQAIKELMSEKHPYSVPELIFLPITDGLPAYLAWINTQTQR